jgi:hypothetical protein
MGIIKTSFEALNNTLSGIPNKLELVLIELGIQASYDNLEFIYLRDVLSKEYKEYLSIDLHNVKNVTICDLSVSQPDLFKCDILTNIGTSEHVEYEEGQYNCWLNIHNWLKIGGTAIHELPKIGSWKGHCRYYIDESFFNNFMKYGYTILELKIHTHTPGDSVWCVLKKRTQCKFMNYEEFFSNIHTDMSINLKNIPSENNPKSLV